MRIRIRFVVALALAALVGDALIAYWNIHALTRDEQVLSASYERLNALDALMSRVTEAETGQRGFLITGDEEYLAPYYEADAGLDGAIRRLRKFWPDPSGERLDALETLIGEKRRELSETIDLRRAGRLPAAEAMVRRGKGQEHMNAIRQQVGLMRVAAASQLVDATARSAAARRTAFATAAFAGTVALSAVLVCLWLLRRDILQRTAVAEERSALLRSEQESRATAEEASRLKDEFLAKLSHELRNPLHAVVGWLQILRQQPEDVGLRDRAMETVERNARSLQRMIEDLLDLSRATNAKLELNRVPTPIAALARSVVETLRPSAQARGVRLEEHITAEDATVDGDSDRLAQVIINLVSNAIKFTPAGGHAVVSVARNGTTVTIAVTDTGLGISPDAIGPIFEAFRQAGPRLAGPEGGLGLGLSIARQIVELHGGSLTAASEGLGKGARFTIALPATSSATPSDATVRQAALPIEH